MMEDEAVGEICLFMVERGIDIGTAVLLAIQNSVSLAIEGNMPPYGAAQDLTLIAFQSKAPVSKAWDAHRTG